MLGLYIHVPFCVSKCPYCDFYSLTGADDDLLDRYTAAVEAALTHWREQVDGNADTLYFGGGTPSLLGGKRLARLIDCAAALYGLRGAEITLEANPADDLQETFRAFASAGGNRLSLGMQSADRAELHALGRRHTHDQLQRAVEAAQAAGIDNYSFDLMLATPRQTDASLVHSAAVCRTLGASHVSAYLLKIEPNTPFAAARDTLSLPDDDAAADRYLLACAELEQAGYRQYEISNFAVPGRESRHNLKYWDAQPYLGVGPAAHSFLNGQRLAYPRDLSAFLAGEPPEAETDDAIPAGSQAEYLLLRLRLTAGVTEEGWRARFGESIPRRYYARASKLPSALITADADGIRLTRQGCLVSNAVLTALLDE